MAPVPDGESTAPGLLTVGDQLAAVLEELDVSQAELARRLAGKRASRGKVEARRRWLGKIVSGEIERPRPRSLESIVAALDLSPDYFKVPTRTQMLQRAVRLHEVAAEVRALRTQVDGLERRVDRVAPREPGGDV